MLRLGGQRERSDERAQKLPAMSSAFGLALARATWSSALKKIQRKLQG